MAEITSNVEFAHKIHEHGHSGGGHDAPAWLELAEALVLAAVAVLTAWSGYQAARWDARSTAAYARASRTTAEAEEQRTLAGQEHMYDLLTFNVWMSAHSHGDESLAEIYVRRFRPEYQEAFKAWLKLDPLRDSNAPPGPSFMPEFRSARLDQARQLDAAARKLYESGVTDRETGDQYVRITVILATVLLLTALSQRFKIHAARVSLVAVAGILLAIAVFSIAIFPRA
jgi:hypothetical protein